MHKKKNWNKVPDYLKEDIRNTDKTQFIGTYFDLQNIPSWINQEIIDLISKNPNEAIDYMPSIKNGRYSKSNILGKELLRRDLPKITKEIYLWEKPNFWDPEKGYHSTFRMWEMYQRDLISPKEISIQISPIMEENNKKIYRAIVGFPLNKESSEPDILFAMNIAQENLWSITFVDIENPSEWEQYFSEHLVWWEIFPAWENSEEFLRNFCKNLPRKMKPETIEIIKDRYEFTMKIKEEFKITPKIIRGEKWMDWYFGIQFTDSLVYFENIHYGNAIYLLFEDWEKLSKLSRNKILTRQEWEYIRILHGKNWKDKAIHYIRTKLNNL